MMLNCDKCDEIFHPDDLAGKCPFYDKELPSAGAAAMGATPYPVASSGQSCGKVDTDRQHGAPQANPSADSESTAQQKALDVMNDIFDVVFPIVRAWHWHKDFEKHPDNLKIELPLTAGIMYRLNDARNVIRDALQEDCDKRLNHIRFDRDNHQKRAGEIQY